MTYIFNLNREEKCKSYQLLTNQNTPRVQLLKYVESRLIKLYVEFHGRGESNFNLYPDS